MKHYTSPRETKVLALGLTHTHSPAPRTHPATHAHNAQAR